MTHQTSVIEAPASPAAQPSGPARHKPAGVHPVVIEVSIAAVLWFLAMAWLSFAWDRAVELDLGVVTLFCVIFLTLILGTALHATKDPRWRLRQESFTAFLHDDDIAVADGRMRGRDVLIEIALIPVALAFAATLIGLAWVIFG